VTVLATAGTDLTSAREASSKLVLIQVLRALAALAIVFYHAQYDAETLAARFSLAYQPSQLLPWPAGVDVFFVVSGFIMVYTSRKLFATPDGPRVFLGRRISRIVPIYWLLTTLYVALALLVPAVLNHGAPGLSEIIKSYLFIPFAQPDGQIHPVLLLGWTLNYEMFFYLLFGIALLLPLRKAVAAVAAVLFGIVLFGQLTQPLPAPLAFWSDPIVLEFVFGMGLALLLEEGLCPVPVWRFGLVCVGLVLLHLDLVQPDGAIVLPRALAYGIPATMLVAAAVFHHDPAAPPAIERWLSALGDASYALYLAHPFAIRGMREIFVYSGLAPAAGLSVFISSAVIAAVILALLLYQFVERPMTRALRRRLAV
jgi:exopolysaccharide production protein ExoZ